MTFVSNTKIPRVFIRSAQQVRKLNNCVRKGKREDDIFFSSLPQEPEQKEIYGTSNSDD